MKARWEHNELPDGINNAIEQFQDSLPDAVAAAIVFVYPDNTVGLSVHPYIDDDRERKRSFFHMLIEFAKAALNEGVQ